MFIHFKSLGLNFKFEQIEVNLQHLTLLGSICKFLKYLGANF
jgi:hypothetical protein